ncbi:MAG: hypothetical protein ABR499_02215 [Gemmatimonadaceae bacterium]
MSNPRRLTIRATLLAAALSLPPAHVDGAPRGELRAQSARVAHDTLRVGVLLPGDKAGSRRFDTAWQGVTLGAEEAARTAALFGLAIEVLSERAASRDGMMHTASRLLAHPVSALVGGFDEASCRALAALATERRVTFLALECTADRDHGDECPRLVYYLQPSAATLQRARDTHARRAGTGYAGDLTIDLWHHTLGRYGAAQLNERYRRRFGADMDAAAWAGWMAMKILTEAALRARSTQAVDLTRYVARPAARFDGHKGEPLAFDRRTGELRQPLYVVAREIRGAEPGRVVAEVPTDVAYGRAATVLEDRSACGAASGVSPR